MTATRLLYPALAITPNQTIQGSQLYQGLCKISWEEECKEYVLVSTQIGVKFKIALTGLLSPSAAQDARYQFEQVRSNVDAAIKAAETRDVVYSFLRYAPWLFEALSPCNDRMLQGVALARLIHVLIATMVAHELTQGRFADSYRLLLRARFLLLAQLHQEDAQSAAEYFSDFLTQVSEAGQVWGQEMIEQRRPLDHLFSKNGLFTESEGHLLLFSGEQSNQIWRFIDNAQNQAWGETIVAQWYLPRYDLRRATLAVQQLDTPSNDWRQRFLSASRWGEWTGLGLLGLPLAVGTLLALVRTGQFSPSWLNRIQIACRVDCVERLLGTTGNLIWAIVALCSVLGGVYLGWNGIHRLRFNLPRLTLAIIVGYLALISSGEMMGAALQLYANHFWLSWVCVLAAYLLCYGALYLEVRRTLQVDEWKIAQQRAWHLLRLGILRALWIAWLVLVPLAPLLMIDLESLTKVQPWLACAEGWFDWWPIYPHVLFIFAPLALFFGIFVQTIWEDNPLTHPL